MKPKIHSSEPWQQFEQLVRRILEANGFTIELHSPRGEKGFDFSGTLNNELWAIEVKHYRTNRPQPHLLEAAAARVANQKINAQRIRGMLVVSCSLTQPMRLALEGKFGINFIDRLDLDLLASKEPLLTEALQNQLGTNLNPFFSDNSDTDQRADLFRPRRASQQESVNLLFTQPVLSRQQKAAAEDTRGTDLCSQMRALNPGRDDWAKYERVCANILKYLFPNDLEGWHKQKRTDDGLNRYDFVCRVRPTTEFWHFLIDHLNSRYVIFEFKNYASMIGQGQILTTEKYLLERGLRRAAIIFSRKGPDENADKMRQGAMREHGKLMLVLNDNQVCRMLNMKERGEDPTDFLFQIADDFLLSLPR